MRIKKFCIKIGLKFLHSESQYISQIKKMRPTFDAQKQLLGKLTSKNVPLFEIRHQSL